MNVPDERSSSRLPHGSAPEDTGHRIATIRRDERAELRASVVEGRDGEPFVRLRAWAIPEGQERGLWPVPGKVINVRLEECGILAEALAGVCGSQLRRDPAHLDEIPARTRAILRGDFSR